MVTPVIVTGWRTVRAASPMHSGHWKPTGADRMHSGQIGFSHRVQEMYVVRSGWR